jgi:hypothetical protein
MSDSCWIANVSDGSTHTEKWIAGELSPWRRLMSYCELNKCYITNLRMTVGKQTVGCAQNAIGYWQSNAMPAVQGVECDEDLHKWHGIGWVEGDTVNIIWGALDPLTHNGFFWTDSRPAEGQAQIIWGPQMVNEPVHVVAAPVKGVKEYAKKIEG